MKVCVSHPETGDTAFSQQGSATAVIMKMGYSIEYATWVPRNLAADH
jgi:hypothetical protein